MIYAIILIGFALWGYWSSMKTFKGAGRWSRERRAVFASGLFFGSSCLLPGVGLLTGAFNEWMFLPLGVSFFIMVPVPCYFETVNVTPIARWGRNFLFLILGLFFLGLSLGVIPLSQEFLRLKMVTGKKEGGQLGARREQRKSVTRGEGRIKRETTPGPPDVGGWPGVNQGVTI
jgi:hypothetical protein